MSDHLFARPEISATTRLRRAIERRNLRTAELAVLERERTDLTDRLGS
jgi:hypothetical protein